MIYTKPKNLSSIATINSTTCFHIESADVHLPSDILQVCYLRSI